MTTTTAQDRSPVLLDALTGWRMLTPSLVVPLFSVGRESLMGEMLPPEPNGRTTVRPTSRHRLAFTFSIDVRRVTDPARAEYRQGFDLDGERWHLDCRAERWNGSAFDVLSWEVRRPLADALRASFVAWWATPAGAADRYAANVERRRELLARLDRRIDAARAALDLAAGQHAAVSAVEVGCPVPVELFDAINEAGQR